MLTKYGRLIREARLKSGATLKEMADHIQRPVNQVSGSETGRIHIDNELIIRTFEFFIDKGERLSMETMTHYAIASNDKLRKGNPLFKRK